MPQQAATIESLGQACEMVKAMQGDGLEWGEDYRPLARQALAGIIEGCMARCFSLGSMSWTATPPPCTSRPIKVVAFRFCLLPSANSASSFLVIRPPYTAQIGHVD